MSDRAIVVAALIIGGAIVASSFPRERFALSATNGNVAWRMDTWSGQVDLCAAAHLPSGPLVRCGATVVVPVSPDQLEQGESTENPLAPLTTIPPGKPL